MFIFFVGSLPPPSKNVVLSTDKFKINTDGVASDAYFVLYSYTHCVFDVLSRETSPLFFLIGHRFSRESNDCFFFFFLMKTKRFSIRPPSKTRFSDVPPRYATSTERIDRTRPNVKINSWHPRGLF